MKKSILLALLASLAFASTASMADEAPAPGGDNSVWPCKHQSDCKIKGSHCVFERLGQNTGHCEKK